MRPIVFAIAGLILVPNAATKGLEAETLQLSGQAGVLGEWELTATLTATGAAKQFSGALLMKHVGICSVDGPEEKRGDIQLQLVSSSRIRGTLSMDGATCTYDGRKTDSYTGLMRCPDRRDVPLVLWLR
jgi:hypothetical protein